MNESDKLSDDELFTWANLTWVAKFRRPIGPRSSLTAASRVVVSSPATGASLIQAVIDSLSAFVGRSTGSPFGES